MKGKINIKKIITKATLKAIQAKELLKSKKGENFVDSGIKILIAEEMPTEAENK